MQRVLNELFFVDKQLDQLLRAEFFEVLRVRVALFRERAGQTVDLGL